MVDQSGARSRDMLSDEHIVEAELGDWRKLGQGLHARFVTGGFRDGVRFLTAVAEVGDAVGHHPQVRMDSGFVDLKVITSDAIYRDDEGVEHLVEWVTQLDVELAQRISDVGRRQGVRADPASITVIELALDTAHAAAVAPFWSALLTGGPEAQGRGTIGDDVRDASGRVPILWFQETEEHSTPRQRFHIDVEVPYDVAADRIAAALATGGKVVDDSRAPGTTVLADPDGNRACVGVYASPPTS